MEINTLYIIRGLPGAGKTSVANALAGNSPVHSADDYFYEIGDGTYAFDRNLLGKAHGQCKARVEGNMLELSPSIFVANTFTTQKELNTYIKLAETYNYRVVSLIVENRHGNSSVHNVSDEAIDAMEARFTIKLK